MLVYDLPPEQWAGMLSNDPSEAFQALQTAQDVCSVVTKAKRASQSQEHPEREVPMLSGDLRLRV